MGGWESPRGHPHFIFKREGHVTIRSFISFRYAPRRGADNHDKPMAGGNRPPYFETLKNKYMRNLWNLVTFVLAIPVVVLGLALYGIILIGYCVLEATREAVWTKGEE